MSIEHLLILLVAGLFIVGPERLPEAAAWMGRTLRRVRTYASGAQEQLRAELGPEFEHLRKPLQDLRTLRAMNPRTMVEGYLFDDHHDGRSPTTTAEPHRQPGPVATTHDRPLDAGERPPFDPDAT